MALNPTLLKPAVIGAGDIALNSSVDSKIAAYNPASVINANVTTIDGGKITTGSITTNQIAAGSITADKVSVGTLSAISANIGTVKAGVIYDSSWDGGNGYKMKIDLNTGRIHIK